MYQGLMHGPKQLGYDIYSICNDHRIIYDASGMPVPLLEFIVAAKCSYEIHYLQITGVEQSIPVASV